MNKIIIPRINLLPHTRPSAVANIQGNSTHPLLHGTALFYHTAMGGILIQVEAFHLPDDDLPDHSGFFGMHIHEHGNCTLPFDQTGSHYNPTDEPHPNHAGDFPPLLSNHGYAWTAFYDARLTIEDCIGRSIIIHGGKDDFTTQPSGNSGDKIGCGVIQAL